MLAQPTGLLQHFLRKFALKRILQNFHMLWLVTRPAGEAQRGAYKEYNDMRNDYVEAVQLALFDLFESKGPNKAVMLYEFKMRLPKGVTDDELQKALDDLDGQHFVIFENFQSNPNRSRFVRGASFQKWRAKINAFNQISTTWNVSGEFSGTTQLGDGNIQNVQFNESDSQKLVELIEKITIDPKAKDKASPILEALKNGTIATAKSAIELLLKTFIGT